MKIKILAIFLALTPISLYGNFTKLPTTQKELLTDLEMQLNNTPLGSRWQEIIAGGNYLTRKEMLKELCGHLKARGINPDACIAAIVEHMQEEAIHESNMIQKLPKASPAITKSIHDAYKTTRLGTVTPMIVIGSLEHLGDSPAGITSNMRDNHTIIVQTEDDVTTKLLGHTFYAFEKLPPHMQQAIIHHELAHLPTYIVDKIIKELTQTLDLTHYTDTYNDLEACVDMTAVSESENPLGTAASLHELLTLYKQADRNYQQQFDSRIKVIEEMQDRIKRDPKAQLQHAAHHLTHTTGPQMARAFSTYATQAARGALGLLQRLPK